MSISNLTASVVRLLSTVFLGSIVTVCAYGGPYLPSIKILQGTRVDPATTYYGSATVHTNSTGVTGQPIEVKELAKGLGAAQVIAGQLTAAAYASRVHQYVYSNIETVFMFGVQKGALGTLIDQAGTPFDQANLMVELLREANVTAEYRYGTMAFNSTTIAQFTNWTGITNATAACRLFVDGGIPVTINSSTDINCAGLAATITTATVSHVWVYAAGQVFDPSFKQYIAKTALNLSQQMGCWSGSASTCGSSALTATVSGANTTPIGGANAIQNVNVSALATTLNAFASTLKTNLDTSYPSAGLNDVIGGRDIDPVGPPVSPVPTRTLGVTWTSDIPDQYRTMLSVSIDAISNFPLYADDIAGRRLRIFGSLTASTRTLNLYLEYKLLARSYNQASFSNISMSVNHPYAAGGGIYMDDAITQPVLIVGGGASYYGQGPVTLIAAFGPTGVGANKHFADLQYRNQYAIDLQNPSDPAHADLFDCKHAGIGGLDAWAIKITTGPGITKDIPVGCLMLEVPTLAESFLSQLTRMTGVIGSINNTNNAQHHVIGTINSATRIPTWLFNVESSVSVVSRANLAADRRAATYSYGLLASRLEATAFEAQQNAWEGFSTPSLAGRFNEKGVAFMELTNANWASAQGALQNFSPVIALLNDGAGGGYLPAGYSVIVPQNYAASFVIGTPPGTSYSAVTYNIGGWMYGYKPGADDRVAPIVGAGVKGASGISIGDPGNAINRSIQLQDVSLKSRKYSSVDLNSGALRFTPPPDLVSGSGEFPKALPFQWNYDSSASNVPDTLVVPGDSAYLYPSKSTAPIHNFDFTARINSDPLQAMGEDSPVDAVKTIAALVALRDLNIASPTFQPQVASLMTANWLGQSFIDNAVVVAGSPSAGTYIRNPDGTSFNPPPKSANKLTQSGSITGPYYSGHGFAVGSVYSSVSFNVLDKDGSNLSFNFPAPNTAFLNTVGLRDFMPNQWSFADGVSLTFQLSGITGCLSSVSNNLGRSLTFANSTSDCIPGSVSDENSRTVQISVAGTRSAGLLGQYVGPLNGAMVTPYNIPSDFDVGFYITITRPDGSLTKYQYSNNAGQSAPPRTVKAITQVYAPSDSINPFQRIAYDSLGRVATVTDAQGAISSYRIGSLYAESLRRGDSIDPLGAVNTTFFDRNGLTLQNIDALNRITSNVYDGRQRLIKTILPEGNSSSYTYDVRHNRLTQTQAPKTGSTLKSIIETTTYVEGPTVLTCVNPATCNQPATTKDTLNRVTTYGWNATTGQLTSVTGPAVTGGNATTNLCYTPFTAGSTSLSLLTGKVSKVTSTVNRVTTYSYNTGNKYVLSSATVDPTASLTAACGATTNASGLNLVTAFSFDSVGNVLSVNGPRSDVTDVTDYNFDTMRRLTRVVSPAVLVNGTSTRPITRYTYDVDGLLRTTRRSVAGAPTDSNPADPRPTDLVPSDWQTDVRSYFATGDLKSVTDAEGNITQYAYDAVGRQRVVTDPDNRQSATVYDAAGQTLCTWKGGSGWMTAGGGLTGTTPTSCSWTPPATYTSGPLRYAAFTYSLNGKQTSVLDANNNQTDFVFDKHDRPRYTLFPDASAGTRCNIASITEAATPAPTCTGTQTYEELWYTSTGAPTIDPCTANGQPCRKRMRNGQTITYTTFDAMDRLVTKTPQGQGAVSYAYNLLSEPTSVNEAASGSYPAHTIGYAYDGAGRKQSETNDSRQVSYLYDAAGNRIRTTWPDAYFVTYQYDALNRMQYVRENSTSANELAFYDYDVLSRRNKLRFAANESNKATYSYELDNNLDLLTQVLNTTTVTLDYGHNKSGQITSLAANDDFYLAKPITAVTKAYVPDKLNRYGSVGGQAATYDTSGSLLTWFPLDGTGKQTYTYDSENRLLTAAVNGSATKSIFYDYDGLGRRTTKTVGGTNINTGGTTTLYLLDGDEEIAELSSTGTVLRRYITGPGIDDRIARAEGSATSNPTKTYYHVNHQGSVIATTDAAGTATQTLSYDDYGNLNAASVTSGEQFRYTGRRFDPETGLYYYRARYYTPQLGRFLQTDPIGYKDDFNLYAYVGNDPANQTDPTGNCPWCIGAAVGALVDVGIQVGTNLASGQDLGDAISNIDGTSVMASAALGAVGNIGGGKALTTLVRGLSNQTKGKIGEAVARVGIAARGEKVIARAERAGDVKQLGNVTGRAQNAKPDFVVSKADGSTGVVEAKFGSSKLTPAQTELKNQMGDAFQVSRTTYEEVRTVGGAAGSVAGGAAGNCLTYVDGICRR